MLRVTRKINPQRVRANSGYDPEIGFGNGDLLEEFLYGFEVFPRRRVALVDGLGGLVVEFWVD
jgi:hypothetical protein